MYSLNRGKKTEYSSDELKSDYLDVICKLKKMRYFNIRRSGRVVCRACKNESETPIVHIEHVNKSHAHLMGFCPFCQTEFINGGSGDGVSNSRISKKSTIHLKFCCFFHKIDNAKYRRIFNNQSNAVSNIQVINTFSPLGQRIFNNNDDNNTNSSCSTSGNTLCRIKQQLNIAKTSMLTLQRIDNNSRFFLNVLQYDLHFELNDDNNIENIYSDNNNNSTQFQLSLDYNNLYNQEQQQQQQQYEQNNNQPTQLYQQKNHAIIQQINMRNDLNIYLAETINVESFHNDYTLSTTNYPRWWHINYSELTSSLDSVIANNNMEFNLSENIDCNLIRIMSLYWHRYGAYHYIVKYEDFMANIEKFQMCIRQECFLVTRYIHMFVDSSDGSLTLSMIIITSMKNCLYFWNDLLPIPSRLFEIGNLDMFIDICFDNSNDGDEYFEFPPSDNLHLFLLNYDVDVLRSPSTTNTTTNPIPINFKTNTHVNRPKLGFNKFFSPLSKYAKVYFYSQTRYGCVRAFDRLLHNNNLANYITDIIPDSDNLLFIYYSSMKLHKHQKSFYANLRDGQVFANESYYRKITSNYDGDDVNYKVMLGKSLFLLNCENIKLVVDIADDDIANTNTIMEMDETLFPNCIFATNIKYRLTYAQTTTYNVVQFHREKLLLEMNNIPTIDF